MTQPTSSEKDLRKSKKRKRKAARAAAAYKLLELASQGSVRDLQLFLATGKLRKRVGIEAAASDGETALHKVCARRDDSD